MLLALLAAPSMALSDEYEDAVERGRLLVEERCARCHAVGRDGASPFPEAPPFHEIVARYPVEGLAEAFAEGITVGHPAMPEFVLPPEEITDLLTYLDDLTR
ncbi:MAG: c-type cytochrome [Rhizobiales bacterium]|nr:c-type cytochrome [Hyphomicrobiales bacterium]